MAAILAVVIGVLYGTGIYMMLRRSLGKQIIGLALLAHGANLLIFTVAGLKRDGSPIVPEGETRLDPTMTADPLPQALILTAIVIGFGVLSFALVLFHRAYQTVASDDVDKWKTTDT